MARSRSPTRIMVCRMRMRFSLALFELGKLPAVMAQLQAPRPPVRTELLNDRPEARAVVHFPEVVQFVGDDVVGERQRHAYQPPVQRNAAMMAAAAPARAGGGEAQGRGGDAEAGRVMGEPFGEQGAGLFAQGFFQQ